MPKGPSGQKRLEFWWVGLALVAYVFVRYGYRRPQEANGWVFAVILLLAGSFAAYSGWRWWRKKDDA